MSTLSTCSNNVFWVFQPFCRIVSFEGRDERQSSNKTNIVGDNLASKCSAKGTFPCGKISRREMSRREIMSTGKFSLRARENFPAGNCWTGNLPAGKFSQREIFPSGKGKFPAGKMSPRCRENISRRENRLRRKLPAHSKRNPVAATGKSSEREIHKPGFRLRGHK